MVSSVRLPQGRGRVKGAEGLDLFSFILTKRGFSKRLKGLICHKVVKNRQSLPQTSSFLIIQSMPHHSQVATKFQSPQKTNTTLLAFPKEPKHRELRKDRAGLLTNKPQHRPAGEEAAKLTGSSLRHVLHLWVGPG